MLRTESSPVQDRICGLKDAAFPGKIQFSACSNTKRGMEKAEGHAISIVPEATIRRNGLWFRPADLKRLHQPALQNVAPPSVAPKIFYICALEQSKFATEFDVVRNLAQPDDLNAREPRHLERDQCLI